MGLFKKKQSYLGVDLGSGSIKVVELLNEGGKPKLLTYGFAEQNLDVARDDSEEVRNRTADLLKEICKKAHTAAKKAVAGLPNFSIFSSIINLPQMAKKDMADAVRWEAKKFIPIPLEEVVLDWRRLEEFSQKKEAKEVNNKENGPQEEKKTNIKILLTAAPKNLVQKYVDILKRADLEFSNLETESFATIRSLVGLDPSTVMILDIGTVVTNMTIIEKSIPILNRSIDVGGLTITKAIANILNVDVRRAEQFKQDLGVPTMPTSFQQGAPKAIETMLDSIVNEAQYILNLYNQQTTKRVEKIILTGGGAFLKNLPQYFSNVLKIRVFVGDPWARVVCPHELRPVLEEIGPRLAVAIGLAMREIV